MMERLLGASHAFAVALAAVLQLLGFRPSVSRGYRQRGACPLHGSTAAVNRSFSANLDRTLFHSFKCGRSGDALDLWTAASCRSPYDAALDPCNRLEIPVPQPAVVERYRGEGTLTFDTMRSARQWVGRLLTNATEQFFQIALDQYNLFSGDP